MDGKTILPRSEVPEEFTWDLSHVFASDDKWNEELEALKAYPERLAAFAGTLGESAKTLLDWFTLSDELNVRVSKFVQYASCRSDQDVGNSFYQGMRSKAFSMSVALNSAGSFEASEIMAIPDETLARFYAEEPKLETYRRSIDKLRRRKAHILSPECEKILAAAGEISECPDRTYSMCHDADMRYPDVTDAEGEVHTLTDGTFVPMLMSADRTLRENAFKAYYKRAGEFRNTYASTLDAQFKQLKFFADARHYNSTLEASLDVTEVPVEVYTNLIDAVHGNLDKMYRYVELRKKILGVDELHMYDVYTPIVADADVEISFEEAKKTALEALAVLGKDYTDVLEEAFSNRWLDVYENTGKRGGAYCTGNGWPHPYVLLNHKDNLDSMFTLVHEMGHAMHTWHSCKYQPVNTAEYVIFVAEVASTCNEILLMRHLLGKTDDRKQRAYLINHFLDQFKGTLYRQTMFAEFELQMGKMAESGEALTADALSAKYLALNKLYFGDTMISDDEIALEWTRIPHFYYNYYVFQYATSFSAAVAIANRILREGESAVKDYKKFLSGGCSKEPVELLRDMGVDMRTPAPVNDALSLFGELIDELSSLLD